MVSLTTARRLVVKIGSALLIEGGALREDWLKSLSEDVAWLRSQGTDVVLVSSGSIALGRAALSLGDGPLALEQAQAAAAVGQIRLARAYQETLQPHGLTAAQILVTLEDSLDRRRYLNSRATLMQLLTMGAVPIVNENDTVATDEIRYGDNDRLAAQIAVTIGADVLVLLSDIDGLYTADPRTDAQARRLDVIDTITPEIEAMAGDAGTGLSKGGMKTKVLAAKTAQAGGAAMAITAGARMNPLRALADGAASTWFTATVDPQTARKRWIGAMKAKGCLTVDHGAAIALGQGKSLLPAGVIKVDGQFGRGDPVEVRGPDRVLATGLSRYTSEEAKRIMGLRSDRIEDALGYAGRAAIIHRDDMAV